MGAVWNSDGTLARGSGHSGRRYRPRHAAVPLYRRRALAVSRRLRIGALYQCPQCGYVRPPRAVTRARLRGTTRWMYAQPGFALAPHPERDASYRR
jgi:hypothetical protein